MGGFSIGYGLGISPRTSANQGEQIIWRILISGAGTASANQEYYWDGISKTNDRNLYINNVNLSTIFWDGFQWVLFCESEALFYNSEDLVTWSIPDDEGALEPAPTAQLFYTP